MTDGPGRQAATLRLAPALVEQTGYLLRIAFVRAGEVGAASLPEGTSVRFYGVLQTLTELGPRSQHELSRLLHVNRTMMVGLIDAMEGAGLVERRRNPTDRRSYALGLTPRGRTTLKRARAALDQSNAELARTLGGGPAERELHGLLRKLLAVD